MTSEITNNLYCLVVPIPDYEGDAVFEQHLYAQTEGPCPSLTTWKEIAKNYHDRDKQYHGEYLGDWERVMISIDAAEDSDLVISGAQISKNTFTSPLFVNPRTKVDVRLDRYPLTIFRVTVTNLDK